MNYQGKSMVAEMEAGSVARGISRRGFHRLAARWVVAAAGTQICGEVTAQLPPPIPPLIDTHLHCFAGPNSADFPYHKNAPYRPAEVASPEKLLKCMDAAGIDYAVVVHPEPYQDDHRYLEHCLEVGGGRLKGTALVFSDRSESLTKIGPLCQALDIVAVRVHAYAPERLPNFDSNDLRELWKWADLLGIAVQLHFEPKYAKRLEPYIREFPSVKVLIDHLGRPFQGSDEEYQTVLKWSDLPNTILKVSSIPYPEKFPHRDIRPLLQQLLGAYGSERMMYGGGFNAAATGPSYKAAFERARGLFGNAQPHELDNIFGVTAKKLFRFSA